MMARQKQRPAAAENGKLYSDALNHINIVIHSGLDFDSIMARVVVEIARTIGAESAIIFLPENDGWVAKYTYGMPEKMLNRHFAAEELSYSAQAARQKAAVVINDPLHDGLVKSDIIHQYGIKAILDVALTISDNMVGNFSIHYHTTARKFTDKEVDFVNKAASTITLALKNALLLQERKEAEEALRANERHMLQTLDRLMILVGVSSRVLGEATIQGTLNQAVAGALAITDALMAASGHGYREGELTLGAIATDAPFPPCPADISFTVDKGGVHLDLLHKVATIRLTQEELVNHPLWWGLPEGHAPLNGLMGARLEEAGGKPNGMILVSHKRHGQFTEEDEVLLTQLCQLTSLAINHIEARHAVEDHAAELETIGRQLKESEQRYRTIFDSANDGFFIHCAESGAILDVNQKVLEMYQYTHDEIIRLDVGALSADSAGYTQERAMDVCRRAARGEPQLVEWLAVAKDGRTFWVEVSLKKVVLGGQNRLLAIVRDISERKRTLDALRQNEERLRLSEERLSLAQSAAEIGMWNVNFRTQENTFSEKYLSIMGIDRPPASLEEFIGLLHPDDRDQVLQETNLAIAQCRRFEAMFRVNWQNGSLRWVMGRGGVLCDEQGSPMRMTGVIFDVTDRKQAEEDLKQAMEELARSNRELEQFAYIASHDLQEPLRMVSSYVKLLERKYRGKLDANADTYINFAVDGAGRMQKLIEGLLAYSRISRDVGLQPVDSAVPLRAALANLEPAIDESGAEVTCSTPLPMVLGNETQLMQLFQNLIGNALKYRKKEIPPRVVIRARRETDEWIFGVEDNGIGIDPRHFERIFQIFQRLHGQEEYEGTGIGLASCKKIVERHGGRIWVESKPGEGSTFYFTLSSR